MKRIFTLLLFILTLTTASAQFTAADIKFWYGEGPDTAILVIDFRDGTTDPSFAWGFHYDAQAGTTFLDMVQELAISEPQFQPNIGGFGFLSDIVYNHHSRRAGQPDYWSTWSGESLNEMYMNNGLGEILENGKWYGASYGFDPETVAPTVTYPAYDSQWFGPINVNYWVGEGTNQSIVVLDFNTESNTPVTYGWGIKYNGTITAEQALTQIAAADSALAITTAAGSISSITYNQLAGVSENGNQWHTFSATNTSDWVINNDLSTELSNGKWFGATYGDATARRPYVPTAAVDNGLGIPENSLASLSIYPNPVTSLLNIKSVAAVQQTEVVNSMGQHIKTFGKNETALDLSTVPTGVYFLKITTDNGISVQKVIKK